MTSEMLEEFDLSQGSFGEDLFTEDVRHLLDGDSLSILAVCGSAAIGSAMFLERFHFLTYQTIPYAPCPNSFVTVYLSSTMKSWLNTLKTLRPLISPILHAW